MAIERRSKFGFPSPQPNDSRYTARLVPLSIGVRQNDAWPLQAPGSATSMTNFYPLDGAIAPRSRFSSVNTIRSLGTITGIAARYQADGTAQSLWVSDLTRHGIMQSNGSISVASFVSAFGLGVTGVPTANYHWHYAQVYYGPVNENVLIAAPGYGSYGTLTMSYQTSNNKPLYSYITGAPAAQCVGAIDNYVVAWNINAGGAYPNRVQWCARGNPSAWTQEGSGFEDLLEMKGFGNRVIGTQDGRLLLFTTNEIWYGVPAAYPAQFQFYPLERTVGCRAGMTVCDTPLGVIFYGSDLQLRLLPHGGGVSQPISGPIQDALRSFAPGIANNLSWGVFDAHRNLYHLFVDPTLGGSHRCFVVNLATGEWGHMIYSTQQRIGAPFVAPTTSAIAGSLFFGNSNGTIATDNSAISREDGGTVTSTWESAIIGADLPGNYKQLLEAQIDYRMPSASHATLTVLVSGDGGTTYESSTRTVSLTNTLAGRVQAQMYRGGALPTLKISSQDTGYELHRVDVTMALGGRR